ncbi:MAG: flagellar assembly protein FliW [Candidatus Wallbacteria bacterium]|nr:flagellar assembly protein FliW [Candidatus Wallbacteria bacterium]
MKYQTSRFGEIEYREDTVIEFPEGIIGFEKFRRYVILGNSDGSMFSWLQSLDHPDLAFVIVSPYDFKKDFILEIGDSDSRFLEAGEAGSIIVYSLVVIPENPSKMTANLQAPLVVNSVNRRGRQVISGNPDHRIRHYILEEMKKNCADDGEN